MCLSCRCCRTSVPKAPIYNVGRLDRHRLATCLMTCRPLCHSLPLSIKVNVAADERDLYRYVFQSFRIFVKACEMSAAAGGGSPRGVDADSREEGDTCRYMDGPLLSEVPDAMPAAIHDLVVAMMRVEEAADRCERRACSPISLGRSSGSSTRSVSKTMAPWWVDCCFAT